MAASYPASAKSFTAINSGDTITDTMWEDAYDEITAIEQALVSSGIAHHLFPSTNSARDLGSSTLRFRDCWLDRQLVIGTASPTATVAADIRNGANASTVVQLTGSGLATAQLIADSGPDVTLKNVSNGQLLLGTNNATRVTIAATGNTTIASTGSAPLTLTSSGGGSAVLEVSGTSLATIQVASDSSLNATLKNVSNGPLLFGTNNTTVAKFLAAGHYVATELSANPSASDLTSGANAKDRLGFYMKSDKLVFAYNNSGTVTYVSIPLDGSTTTWTHSTTAP